jgi:hypothetical protein
MEIHPETELVFKRVNGTSPKQTLVISNSNSSSTIAFKIKTTAPKLFAVRPNLGRLAPGEQKDVTIGLQTKEGVPFDTKRKDKFLFESIIIPEMDEATFQAKLPELWDQARQIKTATSDDPNANVVVQKILRCSYALEGDIIETPSSTAGDRKSVYSVAESDGSPGLFFLNLEPKGTPKRTSNPSVSTSDNVSKELKDAKEKIQTLQAACDGYKMEIERINNLRQRRSEISTKGMSPSIGKQQLKPAGLNGQVVAVLCLLSFLIGVWLF